MNLPLAPQAEPHFLEVMDVVRDLNPSENSQTWCLQPHAASLLGSGFSRRAAQLRGFLPLVEVLAGRAA